MRTINVKLDARTPDPSYGCNPSRQISLKNGEEEGEVIIKIEFGEAVITAQDLIDALLLFV